MSRLFIAEKPSMAMEIAKVLPNPVKQNGYYQTDAGRVTWAYGHVLQQADPGVYDERYEKWRSEDLPIFPDPWKLVVSPSCEKQFNVIKGLVSEATEIVHAGDPDREGQLLIDEILEFIGCSIPVRRILLNALDEKSIRKALDSLRENQEFFTLRESALARSRADWLIGMNLSRAYTLAAQRAGHQGVLPVGRVKTPTLALVVRREQEIQNFVSVNYFTIKASFQHPNGGFQAVWQPADTQPGLDSEGRLLDRAIAEALIQRFKAEKEDAKPGSAVCEKTQKQENPRLPFSLSALQLTAGKRFGYSPQIVLDTAQSLYEKKLTSYPRSDCDFLPESQLNDAADILANFKVAGDSTLEKWAMDADLSLRSRAWNDKRITAHHAIIPTTEKCYLAALNDTERNIYTLIAQAYIAQFYPAHVYDQTKVVVTFAGETFTASGRAVVVEGWRALYRRDKDESEKESEDEAELPAMGAKDAVEYMVGYILDKATQPPKRFTASTLLQAMKEIHRFVQDPELKKQLKEVKGIGTEATRASIIQEIQDKGFIQLDKKFLVPTQRAYLLMSLLPAELTWPDETARWEMTFEQIVDGAANQNDFVCRQKEWIAGLCRKADTMEVKMAEGKSCPVCKKGILRQRNGKKGKFWSCTCYPDCKAAYPDKNDQPDFTPPVACPVCKKGLLRQREGKNGIFWSCTSAECNETFANGKGKPVIVACPGCKTGYLKKRSGSKGTFWSCNRYPDCVKTFSDHQGKPVTEPGSSKGNAKGKSAKR